MFDNLKILFESDLLRGVIVLLSVIIILGLMIWVSVIDMKKQSVTFWKMLVVSGSIIVLPIIGSIFCYCKYLKYFLIGAFILWIFLLFLNVKLNKDKFFGKADFDLLSALFSLCIMYSAWMYMVIDPQYVMIKITSLWYSFFLYLLIGTLIYIGIYLIITTIKVIMGKTTFSKSFRGKKVSVLPMLIPAAVFVPYIILVSWNKLK